MTAWTLTPLEYGTEVAGGGVVLQTPYSADLIRSISPFRPALDLLDELLRSEHPAYIHDRLAGVLSVVPELSAGRILDFGCGIGGSSVVLARLGVRRIVGVDLVAVYGGLWHRRLSEAGYPGVGSFVAAGAGMGLPFADGAFDGVLLNGVLEHLLPTERAALLRELLRIVRREGVILVMETPNRWFPRNSHTKLWFSEWLPEGTAAWLAARCGVRSDFPRRGREAQYRTGFRGMSVTQIERIVRSNARLEPAPSTVAAMEFVLPRNPLQNPASANPAGARLLPVVRAIGRATGIPLAYLAPHLNLIIRRTT